MNFAEKSALRRNKNNAGGLTGQTRSAFRLGARRGARIAAAASLVMLAAGIALAVGSFSSAASLAATAGRAQPARQFRIGHMRTEIPGPLTAEWFRRLQRFLESDPGLREAFAREGYGGVGMVSAEGFNDLVRRMDAQELDCVFCPAVAFRRQLGDYTVVFQLKGPNDRGRGKFIFHDGVVIVNSRHPLFRDPRLRKDQPVPLQVIAGHFTSEPVALVSRYSAAGYIYPCHALFESGVWALPSRPIFCGSSEEVVKMVVSGVVAMGACERGAIRDVMRRYKIEAFEDRAIDQLLTTPGCPTDPVVFRRKFSPDRSELGRRLKNAIGRFFSVDRPGRFRLEDSDDTALDRLKDVLNEFYEKTRGGSQP